MKTISLTVPMDYNALTRASDMLHGLAIDLKHESGEPVESETHAVAPAPSVGASTTAVDDQHVTEPAATEVFAQQPAAAPKSDAAQAAAALLNPASPSAAATDVMETTTLTNEGIDLAPATTNPDASIPWDARIHSSSKAKLAKTPNGWRMKRGVAADLVATVEAELMAAMSASPTKPVTPNEHPPALAPAPASATTTPPPPEGAISTFPGLMAKITASGIDQATVTAAVNKQGLQALPLLAARPDLIPAVAAELFPEG